MQIMNRIEQQDFDKVNKALDEINYREMDSAKSILEEVMINTPENYANEFEKDGKLYIKFWDRESLIHYGNWVLNNRSGGEKDVIWVGNTYPRAYYYLGYIYLENENYKKAIELFNKGLLLEPTNPNFILEIAASYQSKGNHKKALTFYNQVPDVGLYVSYKIKARALRGKGVALIDMNKFASAEKALKKSLKYEPDNENAIIELQYISELLVGGKRVPTSTFVPRRLKD